MKTKDQLMEEFIDIFEENIGFKLLECQKETLRKALKADDIYKNYIEMTKRNYEVKETLYENEHGN